MGPELHLLRPWWLLLLLPLGWLWWRLGSRGSERGRWDALVDPALRRHVLIGAAGRRRDLGWYLLGLGWLVLVLALAGPAWQRESRPLFRIEQARVLVLDLSPSMERTDVVPRRLERARFEVLDLLAALREGSTALIVYGAEPFLVAPLTRDTATIAAQVAPLGRDLLPVQGPERVDLALDMARGLLAQAGAAGGEVLLISDGPGHSRRAQAAVKRLRQAGHRLSVLAILPEAQATSPEDAAWSALRGLARTGGGGLVLARPDDRDLDELLPEQSGQQGARSRDAVARAEHWRDDGAWLLLLLLPVAALAFRRGWLGMLPLAVVLTQPAPALAVGWADLWLRPDQQALRALESGQAASAGQRFSSPRWRAAAYYRAGRYETALAQLIGQSGVDVHYNRGNILARLGRLDEAIAEYEAALRLDPDHGDARHNRALLQGLLTPPLQPGAVSGETDREPPADADQPPGSAREREADRGSSARPGDASTPPAEPSTSMEPADPEGWGAGAGAAAADVAARSTEPDQLEVNSGGTPAAAGDDPRGEATTGSEDVRPPRLPGQQAEQAQPVDSSRAGSPASASGEAETDASSLRLQTAEQLLRQVPDDPAGLLRERFLLQYLRRHGLLRAREP